MATSAVSGPKSGWRTLAAFWVVICVCVAAGAAILQVMGPPGHATETVAALAPAAPVALPAPLRSGPAGDVPGHGARGDTTPPASQPPAPQKAAASPPSAGTRAPGTAIPAPQPALLEPAPDFPGNMLPRIGTAADGAPTVPMKIYAGGIDPHDARPRVAVLLAGMGLSAANSDEAITKLPAGVTLAYSPYAASPDLSQARARGHEMLVSIPMEPAGYPLEDEGPQALLTGSSIDENQKRLEWTLSRLQGYAGATGALGLLRGERFARIGDQMARLTADLTARGLYYIDPRVGEPAATGTGRTIDLVIDDPPLRPNIDANLGALEQMAIDHGAALGLVGAPRPVTVERIAAWAARLASHGVVLVPITAILSTATPVSASK